ncbi:hypothetical protein [Skermanella mucosa]|uniref:hypothetical protein n=1 Tax=Skermanella mucosa TaxID=1789672 RepID=UPI002B205EE1|nr:hypothetical protein [Skermanella mucosa]
MLQKPSAFRRRSVHLYETRCRSGSIYHRFTEENVFTTVLAILMTGILLLGMLRRQQQGIANIGFESALVLALYAGSIVLVFT